MTRLLITLANGKKLAVSVVVRGTDVFNISLFFSNKITVIGRDRTAKEMGVKIALDVILPMGGYRGGGRVCIIGYQKCELHWAAFSNSSFV